jgi:hypothetical protein
MRLRIVVSSLVGIVSGSICFFLMKRTHLGAGDFVWAIHMAQRWVGHRNPYDEPWQIYPFTAGLFGLPFVRVAPEVAAGIFYGLSSALLAFGLTREGYHRLLIFLAYPYWIGLLYVQWSPLIAASAFFPFLLPATMAKPQVGIPIFLSRFSLPGLYACIGIAVASIIALPRWPMLWLSEIGKYQHFFAILVLPGPLILLALLRYRDRDAILLLATSCMPQRYFFDTFILWLIPQSRREILITVVFSWCAGIWRWYHPPHAITEVGRLIVLSTYLPMLVILLLRKPRMEKLKETG